MSNAPIPVGPPIKAENDGTPIVFGVLGVMFHLEAPKPVDQAGFAEVNELVLDWFGGALKWTLLSTFAEPEPFSPGDLGYLPLHAASIKPPVLSSAIATPDVQATANVLHTSMSVNFALACHGGHEDIDAHPYSYRFYGEAEERSDAEKLDSSAMLRVTVPAAWPLDDFRARVCAIAQKLRIRWGAAGLMYSGWEIDRYNQTREAMLAHARRYAGYDVGLYAGFTHAWHHAIRTVNWLTFLGPAFVEKLTAKGAPPQAKKHVQVSQVGAHLLLQAGAHPEEADLNRLRLPPAYVEADEIVRPVRARSRIDFQDPWSESITEKWLRRYEKRVF